jgi:hypothetical protein
MRIAMFILALGLVGPFSASAQEGQPESVIHGERSFKPTPIHVGAVRYVLDCLGVDQKQLGENVAEELAVAIRWAVADSIVIEMPQGESFRVWGLSRPHETPPIIIIQQEVSWNIDVITHEFLHTLIFDPMHMGPEWALCVAHDGAMKKLPSDPRAMDGRWR